MAAFLPNTACGEAVLSSFYLRSPEFRGFLCCVGEKLPFILLSEVYWFWLGWGYLYSWHPCAKVQVLCFGFVGKTALVTR